MIDKQPGDYSYDWTEEWDYEVPGGPSLNNPPSERVSALLGPDGEPLLVPIPRRAMGFDLRPRKVR